jgi:hypothetical protein
MSEYSVIQIDGGFAVLSWGVPLLKFASRAEAENAIAEVSYLVLRPKGRWPGERYPGTCEAKGCAAAPGAGSACESQESIPLRHLRYQLPTRNAERSARSSNMSGTWGLIRRADRQYEQDR